MTRLINSQFLYAHRQLRFAWLEYPELFARLSYRDQMALHAFFAPGLDAPDLALIAHRRDVSASDSSLPQRAGRAYANFHAARRGSLRPAGEAVVLEGKGRRTRRLSVVSVARPDPDLDRIAKTVIALIEQDLKQQDITLSTSRPTVAPPHPEPLVSAVPSTSPRPAPQRRTDCPSRPGTARPSDPDPAA